MTYKDEYPGSTGRKSPDKSNDDALRRHYRILDAAFSSNKDFIYVFDLNGRFVFANKALCDLLLIEPSEIIGKSFHDLQYPEPLASDLQRQIQDVIDTGAPLSAETLFKAPDGSDGMYAYIFCPVFDDEGKVEAVTGTTRDITEQHVAKQALLEADRHKDQFIATLAHELRNPLAPIRTGARILQTPELSPAVLAQTTGIIMRQVDHMARLLEDLLDVARISNNQMRLKKEYVTLDSLVTMALDETGPLIDEKKHQIIITHDAGAIMLDADPVRMKQVLSNILNNAAKYTDASGTIAVASKIEGDTCVISVTDNGIGLSPQGLGTIFNMFAQEKTAIERSQGGLGIGLALAKGLVELHGGTIRASSGGGGQGCRFEVRIPLASAERSSEDIHKKGAGVFPTAGRQILIADDNTDSVTTLAAILEIMGHSVYCAHDGASAISIAGEKRPDIAILDIGMPGLNGFDVAQEIRSQIWEKRPFLIAATGWGGEDDKRKAAAAGFDAHLTKPFALEDLERLLARCEEVPAGRIDGAQAAQNS